MVAPHGRPNPEAFLRVAVLVSGHGRGSNLQALIDAAGRPGWHARVVLVIGTRAQAPAMERARTAGIAAVTVRPELGDDAAYGEALLQALTAAGIGLICLAGYMRLLPPAVVTAYRHRILNVHPGLVPLFGGKGMYGLAVHQAVIESGMRLTGCTVHMVDEQYDHGPIVLQRAVPVLDGDTPESLAARVLPVEHETYVEAVGLMADGRVRVEQGRVRILEATK